MILSLRFDCIVFCVSTLLSNPTLLLSNLTPHCSQIRLMLTKPDSANVSLKIPTPPCPSLKIPTPPRLRRILPRNTTHRHRKFGKHHRHCHELESSRKNSTDRKTSISLNPQNLNQNLPEKKMSPTEHRTDLNNLNLLLLTKQN